MECRFEWNFKTINDQKSYEQFCEDMLKKENPYFKLPANYEQAARLFYQHDNGECVMIELQVPTSTMYEDGEIHAPWLDAYEVNGMDDYNASNEIDSMRYENKITYDNAEESMLALAKEMCE